MTRFYFFLSIIIFSTFCCKDTRNSINFEIVFSIDSTKGSLNRMLKVEFSNHTDQNLIVPNMIMYRRLFGLDQRPYLHDMDHATDRGFVKVPHRYAEQVPDLHTELALHKQAKMLMEPFSLGIGPDSFAYVQNDSLSPHIIFVKAHSHKELYYNIKPGTAGKYMFSFYTGDKLDRDKSTTRGLKILDSAYTGKIEDYRFVYKGFKIDSLEVAF